MTTLYAILSWLVFCLIAGAVARLLVPGRQPIGLLWTSVLGVIGSVVGGGLTWLVTGHPMQPAGWIMSIVGATLLLALTTRLQTHPSS